MRPITIPSPRPSLNLPRHITYWKRCLHTFLPSAYVAMESNRMLLASFTLCALDLLSALDSSLTSTSRAAYIDWVYSCQHPSGGFRGSPTLDLSRSDGNSRDAQGKEAKKWDVANVPATYFALVALVVLGDDLARVRRRECLEWLRSVQRPDGSFAEMLLDGRPTGKGDPRLAYCAMSVRWMLGGGSAGDVEDVRVDLLADWLCGLETYDGGIAEAPFHEAHAGFSYCVISTLALVDRLPPGITNPLPQPCTTFHRRAQHTRDNDTPSIPSNMPLTIHWLLSRQVPSTPSPSCSPTPSPTLASTPPPPPRPLSPSSASLAAALTTGTRSTPPTADSPTDSLLALTSSPQDLTSPAIQSALQNYLLSSDASASALTNPPPPPPPAAPMDPSSTTPLKTEPTHTDTATITAGLNGRTNKLPDTCYAFWIHATLSTLSSSSSDSTTPLPPTLDTAAALRYLLATTQHPIGGFGKQAADSPDLYHSYLGLAAVSLLSHQHQRQRQDAAPTSRPHRRREGRVEGGEGGGTDAMDDEDDEEEEEIPFGRDGMTGASASSTATATATTTGAQEPQLKPLDPVLCVSVEARERVAACWGRWLASSS